VEDPRELTCAELVELVTEYLDGALSPGDLERFEYHLSLCPGCVNYVDQLRFVVERTGRLAEEDIEPAAEAELVAAFSGWHARSADSPG
jgi:hypothetical protein